MSVMGRAPHGARGLKYGVNGNTALTLKGRAPHGARGLKLCWPVSLPLFRSRAPHGARGLKYVAV